jgi:predicted nucleotide-binding protein
VLCVRLGHKLPGSRTIPEVIAADKTPYYKALEAADEAWKKATLDLRLIEELLRACLAAQLVDVVEKASGKALENAPAASPASPTPSVEATPARVQGVSGTSVSFGAAKARVFVGSSVEGLHAAEALQVGLEYDAEVTLWSQGVFGLSKGALETLASSAGTFDFAVLVLTPDDMLVTRGDEKPVARDNVIFELGLFMGVFGRHRVFIVHPRVKEMHLPTDLAGITTATYDPARQDGDFQAALGPACTKIKRAIRDQGSRTK